MARATVESDSGDDGVPELTLQAVLTEMRMEARVVSSITAD